MKPPAQSPTPAPQSSPWWRVGMMWLVIGGPLLVVVASFITLGLAIKHPDPVLDTTQVVVEVDANDPRAKSLQPAMKGRNHAAESTAPVDAPKAGQAPADLRTERK